MTGIAINEIETLIEHFNIQIMRDQIDYIYNGGYSIFSNEIFETNGRLKTFKMRALGIVAMVFEVDRLIQNIYKFFSVQQNRILKTRREPKAIRCAAPTTPDVEKQVKDREAESELGDSCADKKSDKELGVDETQTVFSDDKYTESFEEIEDHIKNLEDKCIDSFESIESRIKSQENIYVDNFAAIESRIKSQETIYVDNFAALESRIKSQENIYVDNFAAIESRIKSQETIYVDIFAALESRIKSQEKIYVDNFAAIENRIQSQDNKLDQILRFMGADKDVGEEKD